MEIPVEYYNQKPSDRVNAQSKWWNSPKDEYHVNIFGVLKKMIDNQKERSTSYINYAGLYSNVDVASLSGGAFSRTNDAQNMLKNKVTYNVVRACIDTAAAKIAKTKPRPIFLTEEGSYKLQAKAKLLNQYIIGLFDDIGTGTGEDRTMYGIGRQSFVDACIFGTGAVKFFVDNEEIKCERVFIDEIIVDATEGRYRNPRQLHQVKLVNRDTVKEMFPKYEGAIDATPSGLPYGDESCADMIQLVESWHLPTSSKSKDGRHVISIENKTLFAEDFKRPMFPFLFQRWSLQPLGFHGRGLAEELKGIQLEINKLLRNIQLAQHLMAVPQIWLDVQSKAVSKHIDNKIGGIKFYQGAPPSFFVPQAMSTEVYNHLERLYQRAFEISGVSQLSASSSKPSGLDSGVALREFQDIESERFSLVANMYEDFFIEATYMVIDLLDEMKEKGLNPVVKAKDGNFFKTLRYSEVLIPKDHATIRVFPTNFLPSTPAGKLQAVQELIQGGFFSQEEALDLLDFPDLSKAKAVKLAPREAVVKTIEHMIEKLEYLPPEPFMDLNFARSAAQNYYLLGRTNNMPEEAMNLLRAFMEDVDSLLNPEPPMAPLMPPMDGLPPEGMPPEMGLPPMPMEGLPPEMGLPVPPEGLPPEALPPVPTP